MTSSGRPGLVLVHEFCGTADNVAPVADVLEARGFHVETPMLAGHGSTVEDMERTRWPDWYRSVEEALDRAVAEVGGPVAVAGVSVGGALAIRAAALRPTDVSSVVLINAALHSTNRLMALIPVVRRFVSSIPNAAPQVHEPVAELKRYDRIPLAAAGSLRPLWRDVRGRLPSVTQPVLVVRSEAEGEVAEQTVRIVREGVASPEVRTEVLRHSGHVATLDREAPHLADLMDDFVTTAAKSPPSG